MDEQPTHPQSRSPRTTSQRTTGGSSWPAVLGIVAILLGALGILFGGLGALSTLFADSLLSSLPRPPQADPNALAQIEAIRNATRGWLPVLVGTQLVRTAISAVLLVGGILLVRRKRVSIPTLKIWAVLQILVVPARMVIGFLVLQATPQLPGAGAAIVNVTLALGFAAGWVLPVFMLIWFWREPILAQVQTWK